MPSSGVYHYEVNLRVSAGSAIGAGTASLRLRVNGVAGGDPTLSTFRVWDLPSGQQVPFIYTTSGNIPLVAGDSVAAFFNQSSGVSYTIFNGANSNFSLNKIK